MVSDHICISATPMNAIKGECLDMQQGDRRTSLPFLSCQTSKSKTKTTSSFFSADDMPSPNKDSVGKPVGFNAEKGNGQHCDRQKRADFFLKPSTK